MYICSSTSSHIKQQHALRRSVSMGSNLDHVDKDVPWVAPSLHGPHLNKPNQKYGDKYN